MKKSNLAVPAILLSMAACQPPVDRFAVSGVIDDAQGQIAYLEKMDIDRIVAVDSAELDEDGYFSFSQPSPDDCFELYRLRVGSKWLAFAVDSVQEIEIASELSGMQTNYVIDGSKSSVSIREVTRKQIHLIENLKELQKRYAGPQTGELDLHAAELIDVFKSELCNEYIFPNPGSPVAYYCLFLSVNGQRIFNPYASRQDAKIFAAVASSMDILYPQAGRTQYLHNLAMKAMSKTSASKPVSQQQLDWLKSIVVETGSIDIELPDYKGNMHKLSDLIGKVVLLDLTAYKTDYSANYNLALRKLYDKYAEYGFEIFQVSFDDDESFWLNSSEKIPWVSVRDESSLNSQILKSYNVSQLPTVFLIDRNGDLVERPEELAELDAKIEALL